MPTPENNDPIRTILRTFGPALSALHTLQRCLDLTTLRLFEDEQFRKFSRGACEILRLAGEHALRERQRFAAIQHDAPAAVTSFTTSSIIIAGTL